MRAILEFDLDKEEDVVRHKTCVQAAELVYALWDIDQYLRKETKYNESLTEGAYEALGKARDEFCNILNKRGINLDELV